MKNIVKNCKNCTISEVWVQVTGMPSEIKKQDPTDPYPLFSNLKTSLEKDNYQLGGQILPRDNPVLFNIQTGQHKTSISPPFWNGEIQWAENNYKKIIRVGHQFFALHSLFDYKTPYINYKDSFQTTLQRVLSYISEANIFEVIQLVVRYVNKIEINTVEGQDFNIGKYFNTSFSYRLNKPLLNTNFNIEFMSSYKKNRIIGINTHISGHSKAQGIINTVQTTGVNPLEKKIKLNDNDILSEIKSVKEELKEVFFDAITEETKNNIMEVEYA